MQLSIVIPVYNVERYIEKTLLSIFLQKNVPQEDFEVIVVNDGTPDNSMLIVERYANIYKNLLIINQDNKGLSGARNTGLNAASGKYVWFVDSDDWIAENCLGYVIDLLRKSDDNVYSFLMNEYDEEGNLLEEKRFKYSEITKVPSWEYLKDVNSYAPMQQYIVKTSFLKENKLFFVEGLVHEDMEFIPRLLLKSHTLTLVPVVNYCYLRRSTGNITSSNILSDKRLDGYLYSIFEFDSLGKLIKDHNERNALLRIQAGMIGYVYINTTYSQLKKRKIKANDGRSFSSYCKLIMLKKIPLNIKYTHILIDLLFIISPNLFRIILRHKLYGKRK